jgi:hypothetical protein
MRTLKLIMMVALALALGAANANASSVDIIWDVSGNGTTGITGGAHTGTIVLTIGSGDTGIGGPVGGAAIGLSSDSTGGATLAGSAQQVIGTWFNLGAVSATSNPHSAITLSMGDLFGGSGSVLPGESVVVGTITVNDDGTAGTVRIGATTLGDDILAISGVSVLGEFSFGGGNIVPEPTTASLLGLGLLGLSIAGRNRKN